MNGSGPSVLALVRHYVPAYKSGGPVRSIENTINALGDEICFRVICRDRDAMDDEPFPGIKSDCWCRVGKADVFYASPAMARPRAVSGLIRSVPADVLYLNSLFDPLFSIWPLVAHKLAGRMHRNVLLAPRGELSAGALELKGRKKAGFLRAARWSRLYRGVRWHSTTVYETQDIQREIGPGAEIALARDYGPRLEAGAASFEPTNYESGRLRLLYLSRIAPDKNLLFALEVLRQVKARVDFSIAGPIEDPGYFRSCEEAIARLPANVCVTLLGPVVRSQVLPTFATHDLFILATVGENFGHVIAESLSVGTAVLLSDRSGWRNLAQTGAGWDHPLESPGEFANVIERCAAMSLAERRELRRRAFDHYQKIDRENAAYAENRRMFLDAIAASRGARGGSTS